MTRQEANKEILRILKNAPLEENLRKADCKLSTIDFMQFYEDIKNNVEQYSQMRWCQLMWGLNINLGTYESEDRFYEESVETLNKLKQ